MRAKYLLLPVTLLLLTTLTSCALLPEEEPLRTAPLVRSYERESFQTALVERGDLVKTERVSCTYVPVQSATLSFAVVGEYVDKVLVQVGDAVEKGQLLAQLRLDDLEERITDARGEVAALELRIGHLWDQYEIDLRRNEITSAALEPAEAEKALKALEERYMAQGQALEDQLTLKRMALETLEQDLKERQIYAPFSGTVTYTFRVEEGKLSSFGETVVTLADSTMSLFRAETELWSVFHAGDEYEIQVGKKAYAAVVADEEALGLEPQEKLEGKKAFVYLTLVEPSFELEDGDYGSIYPVLERRENALHVPTEAVSSAAGQPIVYYQREDGMKAYKPVETGIVVDDRTEILSGLTEGESVIVD